MNNISLLIPLTISLLTLITVIVYYTNKKKKISNSFRDLELKYTETLTLLNQNKEHLDQLNYNYTLLQTKEQNITQQNALLIHKNETLTTTIENQKKEFEDLQQQSLWQFEKIADRIFEDKNNKFNQIQQDKLNLLLTPLKEDIVNFKTTIDKTHLEETKQRSQLDERIKNLLHHTNSISNEANNLASALKGKSQLRGYWGELILERILEQSGLQKGREYFTQSSFKDEYGNNLRPDVTIQLPDNRIIFIDSKVSLIDFEQYSAAQSIEEQSKFLKQHISSTLTHINQLSKKRYDDQEQSIDFTFLFIPIEAAYLSIIEADNSIWTKAYDKRIVIVSPSTLIACLKLFNDLWKKDLQSKNALEIIKKGEELFEKIVSFVNNFEKLGNYIQNSQNQYITLFNQLKEGKGNLIQKANALKDLGLKSNKNI